jgi:signal transduction histidine kinase
MPFDRVTIVWVGDERREARDQVATHPEVDVVSAPFDLAAGAVKEARIRGGVITVGRASDAERFLAAGADEVVAFAEISRATVDFFVRRARTRASARLDGPIDVALNDGAHDGEGLALLAGAMVRNLSSRLEGALCACDRLEELTTESTAIGELAVGVARDVRATAEVVQRILALTGPAKVGMCDLSKVAFEVVAVVQRHVHGAADVRLDVPDVACVIPMGHGSAMQMIASLVRNALENIARAARGRGKIDVRVSIEDELVVLDVSDDGAQLDPELRRRALEADPTATAAPGLSLLIAANQIRRSSGEILIDSSADLGTSVRVFFPASATNARPYVSGSAS